MSTRLVLIRPLDLLFFRDRRQAELGAKLHCIFPPPSVFFGALRSALIERMEFSPAEYGATAKDPDAIPEALQSLVNLIGEARPEPRLGSLSLCGPFLARNGTLFLPAPGNLLCSKARLALPATQTALWDIVPTGLRPLVAQRDPQTPNEPRSGWVALDEWPEALRFGMSDPHYTWNVNPDREFYTIETRHGHTRDSETGTVQEGMLFSYEAQRFVGDAGYGLLVSGLPENTPLPTQLMLGGKHHLALLEWQSFASPFDAQEQEERTKAIHQAGHFFITLASPTLLPAEGFPEEEKTLGLRPVAAALSGSTNHGGWDFAHGKRKATKRLTPAGSVFFYEFDTTQIVEAQIADLVKRFTLQESLCSGAEPRGIKSAGFGHTLIGVW